MAQCFQIPSFFLTDVHISDDNFRKAVALRKADPDADIAFLHADTGGEEIMARNYAHFRARPDDLRHSFDSFIVDRACGFVGRGFVFERIRRFMAEDAQQSGYYIIKGEPGIGKSALLARMVMEHGHIHHFNIALQAINKPRHFIDNVCSQIMARYNLVQRPWPRDAHLDGVFLNRVLNEAAGCAVSSGNGSNFYLKKGPSLIGTSTEYIIPVFVNFWRRRWILD